MPKILEKELEDYIFKDHNLIDGLAGDHIIRQFNLPGYGIIDLLIIQIIDNNPVFKILELKQETINNKTLNQLARYKTGLSRNLEKLDYPGKNEFFTEIQLFAIGQKIDTENDVCYLSDLINESGYFNIILYELDLRNGITFKHDNHGWFNKSERPQQSLNKLIRKAFYKNKCQNTNK